RCPAAAMPAQRGPLVNRLASLLERRFHASLAVLLLALLALAWRNRFVLDDAFIVFRYAENLVRGDGPVFNPGERIEGYTCFLYLMLIAAAMRVGLEPVAASRAIGLLACAGSLLGAFRLGWLLSGSRNVGLLVMLVLGTNFTFSAFATGGLETQLHACLVTGCLALAAGELLGPLPRVGRLAAVSALAGLATLTRPDSPLLLGPAAGALAWRILAAPVGGRSLVMRLAALILPGIVLVGAWGVWRTVYYGDLVPNTFILKALSPASPVRGLFYVHRFVSSYWLEAGIVLALWCGRDILAAGGSAAQVVIVSLSLWALYLVQIGGDFMEFRMLVPALPLLAWLLVRTASVLEARARLGSAFIVVTLVGSLQHALVYPRIDAPDDNESVYELAAHLRGPRENWIGLGRALRRDLEADTTVWIATTAAGAIPYYSGLRTVDMLGPCDRWVARHGLPYTNVPGHRRVASLDYLVRRRVALVIGHPTPAPPGRRPLCRSDLGGVWPWGTSGEPPSARSLVEIPVDGGLRILALYLTPHLRVEDAIASRGWRLRRIADCADEE
ncbi:MAG: hypothetical protein ACRENJ_06375, partial [Candidatus Eiseniibacteriota bacterium]